MENGNELYSNSEIKKLELLAAKSWQVRLSQFPCTICFSYPRRTTPVSVTGGKCDLNCGHCGGYYLKHMKPLTEVPTDGAGLGKSCLISGGCTLEGKVPLAEHLAKLKLLKQGRRFNCHVGLINDDEINNLAEIADQVSFDFIGDEETIREVLGIDKTVDDYIRCYQKLRSCCRVMPHICIGLNGGEIKGEYRAMELLRQMGTDGVTFIIFTPTRGTRFADHQPPELGEVIRLMAQARQSFPAIPLYLGCMRPGGHYRNEIDKWAIRLGINSIVNPTPDAVRLAESMGLTITTTEECCAL